MKKENDELTRLFRTRLCGAEMEVRDGFWEELSRDLPAASQRRRRLLLFRVTAAASVLLVLAASSAAFLYFSPREEMEEAFSQVEAARSGHIRQDGVWVNPPVLSAAPVLARPVPASPVPASPVPPAVSAAALPSGADTLSYRFSLTFSYTATSVRGSRRAAASLFADGWPHFASSAAEGWPVPASDGSDGWSALASSAAEGWHALPEDTAASSVCPSAGSTERAVSPSPLPASSRFAVSMQAGMGLPSRGSGRVPVSAGVTVEYRVNRFLGLEGGLLYSHLHADGRGLHYVGIPLKVNATFLNRKKVDLYATVGGVADKCVAGAPDVGFGEEPVQLAVTAGIGMRYQFSRRLALFVEPGLTHHFDTDSRLATVRTRRPTNLNLLCGLRMTY